MNTPLKKNGSYIILFVVIIILVIIPYSLYNNIKKYIKRDMLNSLRTVVETTEQGVVLWLKEEKKVAESWALKNQTLSAYVEALLSLSETTQTDKILSTHPATEKIRSHLLPLIKSKGYQGFFVISQNGVNVASLSDKNLGRINVLQDNEELLKRAFAGETVISLPQLSDASSHCSTGGMHPHLPSMFLITPLSDHEGAVIALLVLRIDPCQSFTHIFQLGRSGVSGETYAFNKKAQLISESRFNEQLRKIGLLDATQSGILQISLRDPGLNLLRHTSHLRHINNKNLPLTVMAESAISGATGHNLEGYRDYRGVPVIGAWKWNTEYHFGIATEINSEEAFHTLGIIRLTILVGAMVNILLMITSAVFFVRHMNIVRRQSLEDGLTGIANRRMLEIKLEMELARSMRNKTPLSICMIDIDCFKIFNDHSGHLAGDVALRAVAQSITSAIKRRDDLAARYGGEEFCVVLPNTESDAAFRIAEDIRLSVLRQKISRNQADDHPWMTISIGVTSQIVDSDLSVDKLLAIADSALYTAKSSGKNCTERAYALTT